MAIDHSHPQYEQRSAKGAPSGYAPLNENGIISGLFIPEGGDPSMGGDLSGVASNAQIKTGVVGTAELADGSVTAAKLAPSTPSFASMAKWQDF